MGDVDAFASFVAVELPLLAPLTLSALESLEIWVSTGLFGGNPCVL